MTPLGSPGHAYDAARLRWAGLGDVARLLALYGAARPDERETSADMGDWLEHGGALLLEDERGMLLCALRWRETEGGWRVDRIATLPEARGLGFGRWLMTKVEALAIRYNVPALTLRLNGAHDELLPYYQRMGYRPASEANGATVLRKRVGGTWQVQERSDA